MKAAIAVVATLSLLCWPTALGYPKVNLNTFKSQNYRDFIADIREKVPTDGNRDGIHVLKSEPVGEEEFLLVGLQSEDKEVTLALKADDLYLAGYQVGNEAWIFKDISSDAAKKLYTSRRVRVNNLGFDTNYNKIGKREDRQLGMVQLKDAVKLLGTYPSGKDGKTDKTRERAGALLVLIQMVSEATRFRFIEKEMSADLGKVPSKKMIKYEKDWAKPISLEVVKAMPGEVKKEWREDVAIVKRIKSELEPTKPTKPKGAN